jgi:putative tricarboxylic transport membrane protein
MLHAIVDGIARVGDPVALFYLVIATFIGVVFGLLPGLSGLTALALLLPLIYGMEPGAGLAFLLAAHSVVNTGGSVTAILLGIPGAPANTATLIDGFPLAKKGRGGEALGAALAASGIGGVIGVVFLVVLLPVLQPIVLLFGSPETFCLVIMGITFIAALGQQNLAIGLVSAGFGMYLSFFGYQQVSGVPRYWLDFDYLLNGFRLVPLALGLFAIPELVSLARTGGSIASDDASRSILQADVIKGFRTTVARRWLVLRSAVIGVLIGVIPGIGGETAPWVAYASARQSSPEGDRFGEGAIDGVIAPESANNSKEGGALVPTLAFGIPGSSAMALLLGGFFLVGLEPGPDFLKKHMDIAISLALTVALANILAAVLLLAVARRLAAITRVRGHLLAPTLLILLIVGTYSVANSTTDVLFMFVFGVLGVFLREAGFNRPALLLGFVLAPLAETYLHISLQVQGWSFLLRPIALIILGLTLLGLLWPVIRRMLPRRRA